VQGHEGQRKDICMAEAKGANKVAKAELDAATRTPRRTAPTFKRRRPKPNTTFEGECDDMSGSAKTSCKKDAKAAFKAAKANAKVAATK
jgi:hypothetical protein